MDDSETVTEQGRWFGFGSGLGFGNVSAQVTFHSRFRSSDAEFSIPILRWHQPIKR